ncbi:MAG TPA: hypothetical protein VKY56_11430, partial [Chloroflexota bacterium]|nr:hypothetical protein [Chloroflexota bacterium]
QLPRDRGLFGRELIRHIGRLLSPIAGPVVLAAGIRLIWLVLGYLSIILVPLSRANGARYILDPVLDPWVRWDAVDYLTASRLGYWADPVAHQRSPLVLPLYPALVSLLGRFAISPPVAALLAANACLIGAAILFSRLLIIKHRQSLVLPALGVWLMFPYSIVLGAAYAQAVAVLFALACFCFLECQRRWGAAVCATLAALTYPLAVPLWLALVTDAIPAASGCARRRELISIVLSLALLPVVMLLLALFLNRAAGLPIGSILSMISGARGPDLLAVAARIRALSFGRGSSDLLLPANLALGILSLVLIRHVNDLLGRSYAVFLAGAALLGLLVAPSALAQTIVPCFPLFVAGARLLGDGIVRMLWLILSALGTALLTALMANWYPIQANAPPIPGGGQILEVVAEYHVAMRQLGLGPGWETRDLLQGIDDSILLLGYGFPTRIQRPGDVIRIPLYLYARQNDDTGYLLSIRLMDNRGVQVGEGRKVLWQLADLPLFGAGARKLLQGHYYEHDIPIALDPHLPTGVYTLSLFVFRIPTFERLPLRRIDGAPADSTDLGNLIVAAPGDLGTRSILKPEVTLEANHFGDSLSLLGYGIDPSFPCAGGPLRVTLFWEAIRRPAYDYTVFVQMLNASGQLASQSDSYPADGRFPTSFLQPGTVIRDQHRLILPEDLREGAYRLIAGLYRLETMQRLPFAALSTVSDHATLGMVTVRRCP